MGDAGRNIADTIDDLLAATKSLAGTPQWRQGNRAEEQRFDWPVLVEGETANCKVSATTYPNVQPQRFTLTLNYADHCIWRLDYEPDFSSHTNPLDKKALLSGHVIHGPHYHAWSDNRHLATRASLPAELNYAKALPRNTRGWENAFRWFCDETGISQPDRLISLPKPTGFI